MDFTFTATEERFRAELREWLQVSLPPTPQSPMSLAEEVHWLTLWQRKLAQARWVGVHWPREHGGRSASLIENYIFQEEMARAQAPEIINRVGVNLVGPTLIRHGSSEQRRRYLVPILTAEELWCQLFSEPNAGSDLTSLRCEARRDGDAFVVNGQKVWTSYAQFARWGILLARTDPSLPKSQGISFFIVDMHSPGVTVRPLRQMTGSEEFNEVFFDNVRIPAVNLVGELNRGWEIAQTTLAHERGTSARQLTVHRLLLDELVRLARTRQAGVDPCLRQRIAQAAIEVEIFKWHNWRVLTHLLRHDKPGPQSSLVKLFWSEMSQRLHDTAMEVLGPDAQFLDDGPTSAQNSRWQRSFLYYRAATIFAGTSEIQRNIIAEKVLGLPRQR